MYPTNGELRYSLILLSVLLMHALTISETHTLGKSESMDFNELRKAVEEVELVDGHAHNLVEVDSNIPFIHAFSLAHGDAVSFSNSSIAFKVTPSSHIFLLWKMILNTTFVADTINICRVSCFFDGPKL